jgi:hypothetical protein
MDGDLEELLGLGRLLDERAEALGGETAGVFLAEALLKVRTREGAFAPLKPNRAQREFERRRGRENIVLKARQMGITTWVAGRFFLKTITRPGTLSVQVAHTQEAAEEIFRVVRRFYDLLPEELRKGALKTSRANARSLVFPKLDSEYRVETAGDPNAGRGLTVQNLHGSEVARWPGDARATLAGLLAAIPAKGGEVVLESTAQGAQGCFYEEWTHAEANGWVRHFFPWWWEESYRREPGEDAASEEERALAAAHGLSREQIAFRRRIERQFGVLARQEYPESADDCFLGSGHCVFDVEAIERRMKELPLPLERRWAGTLETWLKPMARREYLLAVATAGGGSEGDYAAIEVLDTATGLQCAEYQGRCLPKELAERAATLAREYNNALVVVERNNHGTAVIAYLTDVVRYRRLYEQEGQAGWLTTALSRPRVVQQMEQALHDGARSLMSARLLREMKTFVRDARGRMGAAAGQHDDLVMAMGIGLAARGGGACGA